MSKADTPQRVRQSCDWMRARGMQLVRIWVPDTRAPGFAEGLARQCRVVAEHPDRELDAWLDQLNEETLAELETIVDAIKMPDAEWARGAISRHLTEVAGGLQRAIETKAVLLSVATQEGADIVAAPRSSSP